MRDFRSHVALLAGLAELSSPAEVRVAFAQGMASLGQVAVDPAAVPFEGQEPERLLASVQVALSAKLLDDLSFMSSAGAGCALYALASALPPHSSERRELGRRVLVHLAQCDADSFMTLATALAMGSTRAFDGTVVRARVELAVLLPTGTSLRADALAFALLSRRELAQRFAFEPATCALSARRMAARVLELAARHASLRAQQGDDGELAVFTTPALTELLAQLLADREPLVHHHVASARGLLSAHLLHYAEEIERDLMATQSPARLRRGAMSLAARIAVRPAEALSRAEELLASPLLARDPGLAAALIHGLARVVEIEPEAADDLLEVALARGGLPAAEAFLDLRRELHGGLERHYAAAATLIQMQLDGNTHGEDDGKDALHMLLREALAHGGVPSGVRLDDLVQRALTVHATRGPLAALEPAREALALARAHTEQLSVLATRDDAASRREMFRLIDQLDRGVLASSTLWALLATAVPAAEVARTTAPLAAVLTDLLDVLVKLEAEPHRGAGNVRHLTLRMRRLRTLMHALDTDIRPSDELLSVTREAQLAAVSALCTRVTSDASSAMDRIVHASLARGVDALVRDEQLELADAVLCLALTVPLPEGLAVVSEGSLLPDLKRPLRALAGLMQKGDEHAGGGRGLAGARASAAGLSELAHALPSDESPRTEALRRALLGLVRASEAVLAARTVRELLHARRALALLEGALLELVHLVAGARRRLGLPVEVPVIDERCVLALTRALESGAVHGALTDLAPSLEWLGRELTRALPGPLARATMQVLATLHERPLDGVPLEDTEPLAPSACEACPLPVWVPPSRRLGRFVVLRALGAGLASSVFLVKPSDQRADRNARALALKVPRYDGRVARALSEAAFEAAFAEALPALLSVPPHENLAAFVGIEPSARPKPFLVMEWIEGPTLSRVRKRKLAALSVIDGILAGLEVLHALGIGHLDVAPNNVILRVRDGSVRPVLVDFGCAGRQVRPGVGQANYLAPELWCDEPSTPMAVDVYAAGCLAYELITGLPLFHGANEARIAAEHLRHDGVPQGVAELAREPRTAVLANWLTSALRRDPRDRASVTVLRQGLRRELNGAP